MFWYPDTISLLEIFASGVMYGKQSAGVSFACEQQISDKSVAPEAELFAESETTCSSLGHWASGAFYLWHGVA
jgi:hypothetical protein